MGLMRQRFKFQLVSAGLLSAVLALPTAGRTQQWELDTPQAKPVSNSLQWSAVPNPEPDSVTTATTTELDWEPLTAEQIQQQQQAIEEEILQAQEKIDNPTIIRPPSGPTFANYRALWRDGDWLPQISNIVPVGFGPQGVMLSLVIQGTDCTLGKSECQPFTTYPAWKSSLNSQANGEFYQAIGFGDPIKAVSVILTNSLEKLPADVRIGNVNADSFQGAQTGVHVAKAFGPDTSVRVGVENLITWDRNDYVYTDMVRNFYAVASQRVRLQPKTSTSKWFRNLYLTGGIGNGEFKPIDQVFIDQTAALRAAGCATYGYTPKTPCSQETFKRALRDGSDYGQLNPIGSLGLEVYDGFHLIAEWTGRNFNAGFSWRPFPELGLIITPMFNSLVRNCEYPGCTVELPDYPDRAPLPSSVLTQRARLSIQASMEVKF